MALRGDLIRRVTTFLHGYNNIPCARYLSISPPRGGIFKSDSNKQTRFHRVFSFRQQKGERSGKLVTTFETGKSRPSLLGKNNREIRAGKTGFSEQLFFSDDGRARCWKTRFPSRWGRKKARGLVREKRLVNSSRSAPFPYERQPFDKSATKDL